MERAGDNVVHVQSEPTACFEQHRWGLNVVELIVYVGLAHVVAHIREYTRNVADALLFGLVLDEYDGRARILLWLLLDIIHAQEKAGDDRNHKPFPVTAEKQPQCVEV